MPLFYFPMETENGPQPDHVGLWLPNLVDARTWVGAELHDMVDPIIPLGFNLMTAVVTIADENSRPLERIAARDVLALRAS